MEKGTNKKVKGGKTTNTKRKRRTKAEMEESRKESLRLDKLKKEIVKFDLSEVKELSEVIDVNEFGEISKYKTNKVLSKQNYDRLKKYFDENKNRNTVKSSEQVTLLTIFNMTFDQRKSQTLCSPCFRPVLRGLKELFDFYNTNVNLETLK